MAQPVVAFILAAWVVEAIAVGAAMGRRGYDRAAWTTIAFVIGPLSVPVALYSMRRIETKAPELLHAGRRGHDGIDVLVGIDGSPESAAVLHHVHSLLGSRVGRLTLAQVIPIDAAPSVEEQARRQLQAAASDDGADATQIVLRGRPVDALRDYADRLGYELVAVGARGEGKTYGLVGKRGHRPGARRRRPHPAGGRGRVRDALAPPRARRPALTR